MAARPGGRGPLRRHAPRAREAGAGRLNSPKVGILEWFHVGEKERVEHVLADLRELGVDHLRTGVSWADWHTERGQEWVEWLLPRLAQEVDLLPCFAYTPPSLGLAPRTSSPPKNPKAYADFLDQMITKFGPLFEWVELWNEPNNRAEWDWTLDPSWTRFCEMIGAAAYWTKKRGKRTLLGGMSPVDPNWLDMMFQRGVMEHVDAIGVHGFPGTWEVNWDDWDAELDKVRQVLLRHRSRAKVWITEVGYSTWNRDEVGQLRTILDVMDQPVERVYWYAAEDLAPDKSAAGRFHLDEREYHFGLRRPDGSPKLLHHLWRRGGLDGLRDAAWLSVPPSFDLPERPVVITGGAGFVGVNLAHRLLSSGRPVLILDNLSRQGTYDNLLWLRGAHGARARVRVLDIRNAASVRQAVAGASAVYHLAAQVAVTTSLASPRDDFEVNAQGTLNVLEALRQLPEPIPLVFTSTNKVYGAMHHVKMRQEATRYAPVDDGVRARGFAEDAHLDFHSPYGCSKGSADQYVLDHARVFELPHVVFRMSCVYGPHQHGNEDQGWVAHFLLQAMREQPITIYGDGRQVRDVLFVDDLVDAFLLAERHADRLAGRAFNIGGGPSNTLSLLELVERIPDLQRRKPQVKFAPWRTGDQLYYVSDTRALEDATGWRRAVSVDEGLVALQQWLDQAHQAPKGGRKMARPASRRR